MIDVGKIWFVSWLGVGEEEDNSISKNSDFYPLYDVIMGPNRVKKNYFSRYRAHFLMDLGQIWFVSWLGVGEEEDNSILQNSDFYRHYDIIMGKNRAKTVFSW